MVLSSLEKLSLRPSGEKASIPRGRAAWSSPVGRVGFRMKSYYLTFQTALSMWRRWVVWRLVILRSIDNSSILMIRRNRSTALATLLGEKCLASINFDKVLCAEYPSLTGADRFWAPILPCPSMSLAKPEEPFSNYFWMSCLPSRNERSHAERPLPSTAVVENMVDPRLPDGVEVVVFPLRLVARACWRAYAAILWRRKFNFWWENLSGGYPFSFMTFTFTVLTDFFSTSYIRSLKGRCLKADDILWLSQQCSCSMPFSCKKKSMLHPPLNIIQLFLGRQNSRLRIHRFLLNCRHHYLGKDLPEWVQLWDVGQVHLLVTEWAGNVGGGSISYIHALKFQRLY